MKEKLSSTTRNSNIELLRIIAMIMIVAHHYSLHGFGEIKILVSRNIIDILFMGGKTGVNIFVLISGYYMVDNKKSIRKKLIKIEGQILFYTLFICVLFSLAYPLNIANIIKSILPTWTGQYWYVSCYFILIIFSKYINIIFESASKAELKLLIEISILLWSIGPYLNLYGASYFNEVIWFFVLYCIGAYIRFYGNILPWKSIKTHHVCLLLMLMIVFGSPIVNNFLNSVDKVNVLGGVQLTNNSFWHLKHPFNLLLSYELFYHLVNLTERNVKWINTLGGCMFGVYLISENIYIRNWLYNAVLHTEHWAESPLLIIHAIISVIGIFAVCITAELLRINIFHMIEGNFKRIKIILRKKERNV